MITFCIIFLSGVSIFAQGYPSDSEPVDCAALAASDQNAEAFDCFGRAIETDPTSAFNWAGQGDVMNNIGYYYQALVYYEMAINLDPYSSNILTSKGRTLTSLGKYDDAMESFGRALDLLPDNAYTWKSIGDLYTLLHDTAKAQAAYARANDDSQPATQSNTP
jgi:tetratricopeptide (TPR) repeat protein